MKKNTRAQKTLDGTLTIMANGERSTISTRCADLNLQMPLSLGVSAAILKYVIFCHQEESTWPLSEPSVLKKHFDEIFEALKYTKALEQIKLVRKDQLVTVKIDNVLLDALRSTKERAAKTQREADNLLEDIRSLHARIDIIDVHMANALEEQDELFRSGQEFERIIAELDKYRHEKRIMRETFKDLSRNIVEYQESNEALQEMQSNFASTMAKQETVLKDMHGEVNLIENDLVQQRALMNEGMAYEGQLRAEADHYNRQIEKRKELVKSASRLHNIRGYNMSLSEDQISEFKGRLSELVKTQTSRLERIKQNGRDEETKINSELQGLLTRLTEHDSLKNSARGQIKTNTNKIKELQFQLDRSTGTDSEMASLNEQQREVEEKILQARANFEKSDWEGSLREKTRAIRNNEDRMEAINREITLGNRQANSRAKLSILQTDLKRREQTLQALLSANSAVFTSLAKRDLVAATLESDVRSLKSTNDAELEDAERTCDSLSKEVSHLEAQIGIHQDQARAKKKTQTALGKQISEVFEDPEAADREIENIEQELEIAQGNYYQAQYAVKFYERAISFANEKDCCQLCNQSFYDEFTKEDFSQLIDQKKAMVPKHLAKAQESIESCLQDLNNAKTVQPARSSFAALQAEIPRLEMELTTERENLTRAIAAFDHAQEHLQETKRSAKSLSNLEHAALEIAKTQRDIVELKKQISSLETELSTTGSKRSMDDMQCEISALQEEIGRLKKNCTHLQEERESGRAGLQNLDNSRRDIQLAMSETQGRVRDKENLAIRLQECQEAINNGTADIEIAEQKSAKDQPEILRLRTELDRTKLANNTAEGNAQREASRLVNTQNSLLSADEEINAYLLKEGPDDLRKSREKLNELKAHIQSREKDLSRTNEEIVRLEKKNSDLQNMERNINDNLRLRKVSGEIERLTASIQKLEDRNAVRDRDQYVMDSKRLKDRYSKFLTERAGLVGEITQMEVTLRSKQKDLDGEFKGADEAYRTKLISVRTMEKANEDLDKYGRALDSAIMKYHSLKMEEINKIVDELWKATYCGTDVDSISIRSDEGETAAANRSYKYRVCMIKGEAELDMRGRCSAGQKVLAAIIIRLALAECFGVNCGILALDEPTTNLDRENIESLAKSLANVISVRRSQKNFQLIVITHDEEFLRMMGCSDYCDYYYRVSRNEHQKSEITKQRVSTVL